MKDTPNIDIIVPVYNTEKYLRRCLDSLLNQSYENYSVILVDDGSEDASGVICDEYNSKYHNVKVVHQENKGLSAARNAGVINSDAQLITFVDSDDYVAADLLKDLEYSLTQYGSDMSIIHMVPILEDRNVEDQGRSSRHACHTEVMDSRMALMNMCYKRKFGVSACGKLYKRELLLKHPYPEGTLYEDIATTHKIIIECQRIVYSNNKDYYYVQHVGDGITRGRFVKAKMDGIQVAIDQKEYIAAHFPELSNHASFWVAYACKQITKSMTGYTDEERNAYREIATILRECLYKDGVLWNYKMNRKARAQMLVTSLGYRPMKLGWMLYYFITSMRKPQS